LRGQWSGRGTGGADLDYNVNADAAIRSDTGYKDFNHEPSAIVGFASKGTDFIVAKGESMVKGWLVTEDTVFEWDEETIKRGCISGKTLVNDKAGLLYYFCNDFTLRELDTPDPLSGAIDKIMRDINPEFAEYSQASYIPEYKCIFFAVPTQDSETNNLVIEYNTITTKIYLHDIAVRAFCGYRRQVVYGYDTLPYDTYDEWGIAWLMYDTKVNTVGYPLDICSDYSGNTFILHEGNNDDGAAWTGKLVFSTTLTAGKTPYIYKRVPNGMDMAFNRQASGTIAVRVKKDTGAWQSLGSVNLAGVPRVTSEQVEISGLVAHYKMTDDTVTTTVLDEEGNNGVSVRHTDLMSSLGRFGKALRFDGVNDFIRVPHSDVLDFGTNDFSVCFDMNLRDITQDLRILQKSNGAGGRLFNVFYAERILEVLLCETPYSKYWSYKAEFPVNTLNNWVWVCITKTSDGVRIFFNNVESSTEVPFKGGQPDLSFEEDLYIGCDQYEGFFAGLLPGSLKNLMFFNKEISVDERMALWNNLDKEVDDAVIYEDVSTLQTEDVIFTHLPFDKRARVFYFEISSSGQFELLGMVFRELYYDGDR
jgi:hypothetical protein